MSKKNVCLVLCGLALLLILAGCAPQVAIEGAGQGSERGGETAVPASSIPTMTPVPPSATPSAIPQPSEVPMHPEEPTPLPNEGVKIDYEATLEGEPTLQPAVRIWVEQAQNELAQRLDISVAEIELLSFESKTWPDGSLGCPQPGMRYVQVTTEGYLIRLQAGDQVHNFHGGRDGGPFLCLEAAPQPEIVITRPAPPNIKEIPTKIVPPPRD